LKTNQGEKKMKNVLAKYAELKKMHEVMCENFDTIPYGNLTIVRPTSDIAIKWFSKKDNHNCKKIGDKCWIEHGRKTYDLFNKFISEQGGK